MRDKQHLGKAAAITLFLVALTFGLLKWTGHSGEPLSGAEAETRGAMAAGQRPTSKTPTTPISLLELGQDGRDPASIPNHSGLSEPPRTQGSAILSAANQNSAYRRLTTALRAYRKLNNKPLRSEEEENQLQRMGPSTENLNLVTQWLLDEKNKPEDPGDLEQSYLIGVNYLVDALKSPQRAVALESIKQIIEKSGLDNSAVSEDFKNRLAKSKALLLYYAHATLEQAGYDLTLRAPDEQTRTIYQNVLQEKKAEDVESEAILSRVLESKTESAQ